MAMSGSNLGASGAGMGGNTPFGSFWAAFPDFMQWAMGNSDKPYQMAGNAYQRFFNQGTQFQNPFFQNGQNAMGQFNDWLNKMKDPTSFINNAMQNYQQSPWAKYLQQASMRAGNNAASAAGLTGSTPFAQQMQQNAQNISSGDMQNWLGNVLGINNQYGQGLYGEMGMGQNAANNLSNMFQNAGQYMGGINYGEGIGQNMDENALWAGISKMLGG